VAQSQELDKSRVPKGFEAMAERMEKNRLEREARQSAEGKEVQQIAAQTQQGTSPAPRVLQSQQTHWPKLLDENGRCTVNLNDPVQAQDIISLYRNFSSNTNTAAKSPYETKEQYESRIRNSGTSSSVVVDGFTFKKMSYDPEEQHFIFIDNDISNGGQTRNILVKDTRKKAGVLTTTGGWGGTSRRNILKGDMYYLDLGLGHYPSVFSTMFAMDTGRDMKNNFILLKMSRSVARINHGKLRTAYVITPKTPATSSNSYDKFDVYNTYRINANVHCALILDKDRRVVKVVHASRHRADGRRKKPKNDLEQVGKALLKGLF